MSMTHEEAARILDPDTTREALNPYADSPVERMRLLDEACRIAADVLRNKPTGKPLTLEQLRKMDGQPVWVETKAGLKFWGIVTKICVSSGDGRYLLITEDTEYGQTWLAYAYPPAHIDRDYGKDANVPTNADCIRAMSDEELAKAMDMLCPPVTNCIDGGECVKCWTDWLRQPAEGE